MGHQYVVIPNNLKMITTANDYCHFKLNGKIQNIPTVWGIVHCLEHFAAALGSCDILNNQCNL